MCPQVFGLAILGSPSVSVCVRTTLVQSPKNLAEKTLFQGEKTQFLINILYMNQKLFRVPTYIVSNGIDPCNSNYASQGDLRPFENFINPKECSDLECFNFLHFQLHASRYSRNGHWQLYQFTYKQAFSQLVNIEK